MRPLTETGASTVLVEHVGVPAWDTSPGHVDRSAIVERAVEVHHGGIRR